MLDPEQMTFFSHTLGMWAREIDGILEVQIRGTPDDFQALAELAAGSGGSVTARVRIQTRGDQNRPNGAEAAPDMAGQPTASGEGS